MQVHWFSALFFIQNIEEYLRTRCSLKHLLLLTWSFTLNINSITQEFKQKTTE